jgi:hypothetical protein
MTILRNAHLIFVFLFLFIGCKDDNPENAELIDLIREFSLSVDLQDPDNQDLILPNSFKYIEGGLRGIVVMHRTGGEYVAFERNCSFLPASKCATITMHSSQTFFLDTCCSSQFFLTGEVKEAPANQPIFQYRTFFEGSLLWITYP